MLDQTGVSIMRKTALSWIWVSVLVIILDQLSKYWVSANFDLHETLRLVPNFSLYLAHNYGAAFSMLRESPELAMVLFSIFAGIVVLGLTIWLYFIPAHARWLAVSITLILGGAMGNLIDRVRLGYVVDFFDFFVGAWHWPTFNVADIAICIGAAMMIIDVIFFKEKAEKA